MAGEQAMDGQQIFAALLEPAGMADPYPLYDAMRALGDAVPTPGLVFVPGYEAVSSVLRDPEYRVNDAEWYDRIYPGWREHPSLDAESLLNLNGADHARIRTLMARTFTFRRVQALEPAIAALTDELLDSMADKGADGSAVDFMREFAFALPVAVICELVGAQEWDIGELRPLARSLTAVLEPFVGEETIAEGDAAAITMAEMFDGLLAQRRAEPKDDLVSQLVAIADARDASISQMELVQNLILLLVAGFETTTNLLGNGVRIVLDEPAVADALRSGGVGPEAFVEEVLRFDSPVQETGRRRANQGQLCGVDVSPDDQVVVMLGAANRDPRRFADPDAFRPERTDAGPLSFGGGAHFCLGAALARLEAAVAFPMLLNRFPKLAAAGEPERRLGLTFRGFEHLPVSVS
jgi:cytochrome P450